MGQKTQPFKRSMAGSIGAGIKSILGGEGRRYYVLEHKVSSKYHKAGEEQQIIVDQVEIGRGHNCAVRLDGVNPDDPMFRIVSRKHAAIEKDGDNWALVHLSTTNSTFLNGRRLNTPGQKWYLQNGDEIQIAESGPKLGFKIPQGNKGKVSTIGLTRRLSLFRKQALRPYKQGIIALACLLLIVSSVGGKLLYDEHTTSQELKCALVISENARREEAAKTAAVLDSCKKENANLKAKIEDVNTAKKELQKRVSEMMPRLINAEETAKKAVEDVRKKQRNKSDISNDVIAKAKPYVFFIQTQKYVITLRNGESTTIQWTNGQNKDMDKMFRTLAYTGTGFLTLDNRFITARHVAEGWYFWIQGGQVNEAFQFLNQVANNGGKVVAHFIAVSSSGKQLSFNSNQFNISRATDKKTNADDGSVLTVAVLDNTDWAYIDMAGGGLKVNKDRSQNLERNEHLSILGFPLGIGANSTSDINPMSSEARTAHEGLQNGVIITTATTYEQGNSGGPVFALDDNGNFEVIGIVSAGAGRSTGFVVPISAIN